MFKLFGKPEKPQYNDRVLYRKKHSGYGTVIVRETFENDEWIHLLTVDGTRESAAYTAPDRHNDLVFPYTKEFEKIFFVRPELKSCLMLGGAGCSYPRYYISRHPECSMDVVEINPEMFFLAKKYFYLDELFREYELEETGRLSLIIDDAAGYLRSSGKVYDAVINDAYISNRIDMSLISPGNTSLVKSSLSENGVYLVNLISAVVGELSMPRHFVMNILSGFFENLTLYPVKPWLDPASNQNCVIIASDAAIPEHVTEPFGRP
ncbi:MAG: fused MFS/spermidine synthase [Lachnospiraceae bacterium]|nr:fused MFS/spermidine synthase [Lachnospiraceae bacterium]